MKYLKPFLLSQFGYQFSSCFIKFDSFYYLYIYSNWYYNWSKFEKWGLKLQKKKLESGNHERGGKETYSLISGIILHYKQNEPTE